MPGLTQSRAVGTLGGPGTFAGQATRALLARVPELGAARFFSTMEEIWAAAATGAVDSVVITSETSRTGVDAMARHLLASDADLYINGEILVPYQCMLLGKPNTRLDQIRLVLGHGSLVHCQAFLAERLPWAQVRMHNQNSLAAAQEVLAGDGSIAVVGTLHSADINGLAVLERDIDRGSVGAWWIISRDLRVSPRPDVLVVRVTSAVYGAVEGLLSRLNNADIRLRGIAAVPAGSIFSYDFVVVLCSTGPPLSAGDLIGDLAGCRLLGAFQSLSSARIT